MPHVPSRTTPLVYLLLSAACSTWQPVTQPVPELAAQHRGAAVRLSLSDGSRVEMNSPTVSGDSVVGTRPGGPQARIAVPLGDILLVERSQIDGGKTTLAVLGGVAAVAGLIAGIAYAQSCTGLYC